MKHIFILFTIAMFLATNSYATERKRNMNLFNDNGAIMPFHIGGVFCDKYGKSWHEKCQDALLEDVYGHIWPEVKQIILDFQKAVVENDYRYLKGKMVIPKEKLYVYVSKYKYEKDSGKIRFIKIVTDRTDISREKELNKVFFSKISDDVRRVVKNIKYEDITVNTYWSTDIEFGGRCDIRFKLICDYSKDQPICHYVPKIDLIGLELIYLDEKEIFSLGD